MKREDLVRFSSNQIRVLFVVLVLFLGVFALSLSGMLQRIYPAWNADRVIPAAGAVALIILVIAATRGFVGLPKCPHCKRLLSGWLLHIAIASGNCGYCGKSIED